MRKDFYISLFLSLVFSSLVYTQEKPDTTLIISAVSLTRNTNEPAPAPMDTFMLAAKNYNPVFVNSFSNTFLGNTGQAYLDNKFYARNASYPFLFAYPYQTYLSDPYKISHFNTRKPFTQISYLSSGSRETSEQVIKALHTQNVNPKLNIGILYDLIASRGIYLHQGVGSNRLSLFSSYKTKAYSLFASAHSNSIKTKENGGIVSIDNFIAHSAEELNYRMFLTDANSRLKNYSFFLTQKYVPSFAKKDSLATKKAENIAFQHTLKYNRYAKIYKDKIAAGDTLNFYRNNYYFANTSYDSAFYHELENRFDISFTFAKGSQELRAYLKHRVRSWSYNYPQPISRTPFPLYDTAIAFDYSRSYNDVSVGGQFSGSLTNWEYNTNAEIALSGYSGSDILLKAQFLRYFSEKQRRIELSGSISSLKPDFYLYNYSSSHFKWSNDFLNTDNIMLRFDYTGKKAFKLNFVLNYLTGYTYFDSLALPAQFGEQIVVPSLYTEKEFVLGPVHSNNKLLFQKPSNDIIHLPLLAYGNTSYYENRIFKGVLGFQIGFTFYYYMKYYPDAYMPAIGMFYWQNDRKSGNYPFVDGFLNINLKRTNLTFQYTNALAGIAGYDYFMAYRHPTFKSSFKFGLSWTFYD